MVNPEADAEKPTAAVSTDSSLVRYLRDGQKEAAEELYHRYAKRLWRMVNQHFPRAFSSRFDPDDIVQSVFRVFYSRVQQNSYEVPKSGEIWSLLYVIAMNKLRHQITHHKAEKRNVFRTSLSPTEDHSLLDLCENTQSSAMLRFVIEDYLANLSEDERAIIALRMNGHSVTEIATKTNRALRSVERILQKARQELMKVIEA